MPLEATLDALAASLLETLRAHPRLFGSPVALEALPQAPRVEGAPEFVLESEAAAVFGDPGARSVSLALPVFDRDSLFRGLGAEGGPDSVGPDSGLDVGLRGGAAWLLGAPLAAPASSRPSPRPWIQIVVTEAPAPASRGLLSRLACMRSLPGRLPGYLAHSVDSQIGGRVHRTMVAAGLSQPHLARALLEALRADGFVGPAWIVVGEPSAEGLAMLQPCAERWAAVRRELSGGGGPAGARGARASECGSRECGSCDERQVCDWVRAAIAAESRSAKPR